MLILKYVLGGWLCCVIVAACGGSVGSDGVDGGSGGSMAAAGTGGSMPAAGAGGNSARGGSGGQGGAIDCSLAGCAPPPMCKTGCTDVCGCCLCADGMVQGNLVCKGGCWVESGDGGSEGCSYRGRVYAVG